MENKMIINGETWIRESSLTKTDDARRPSIKDFTCIEDVFNYLGESIIDFKSNRTFLSEKQLNQELIEKTIALLNEVWEPDYRNRNQAKYYPYFRYEKGSFVFYDVGYDYYSTTVGSSLSYKSEKLCKLGVKILLPQYNKMLLLNYK